MALINGVWYPDRPEELAAAQPQDHLAPGGARRGGGGGGSTTTLDPIWTGWVQDMTTATTNVTTAMTAMTAMTANFTTISTTLGNVVQDRVWFDWVETEAERVERLDREQRRREEVNARRLADRQRMDGAQERALELFLSLLTPVEREWYDTHQAEEVAVRGSDGGLFRIEMRSVHGNLVEVDEHGCSLGRVCVAPGMVDYSNHSAVAMPLADGWIGQYLAIKFAEAELRAAGNWSYRGLCRVDTPRQVGAPTPRMREVLAA